MILIIYIGKFKKVMLLEELELLLMYLLVKKCWVEFLMLLVILLMDWDLLKLTKEIELKLKHQELFQENLYMNLCKQG